MKRIGYRQAKNIKPLIVRYYDWFTYKAGYKVINYEKDEIIGYMQFNDFYKIYIEAKDIKEVKFNSYTEFWFTF